MPILHLDSQPVRQTGRQLTYINDTMLTEAQKLNTRLTLLRTAWLGNSSLQFQQDLATAISRLRRLADEAADLNRRLQRKVDDWEEVDRYF